MDATASSLSSCYAFGAAVALAVLLGVHMRDDWRREHRIYASDVVWTLFYISLLLFVGIFCALGLMGDDVGASGLGAYSTIMLLCGSLTLFGRKAASMPGVGCASSRRQNSEQVDAKGTMTPLDLLVYVKHASCSLLAIAAVSIASAWVIDFIWLESSGDIQVRFFAVTSLLFFIVSVTLFLLGQCHGAFVLAVPLCAVGLGIGQHLVVSFKGVPIMPADFLSLNTAIAVAGGYTYVLTSRIVVALCVVGICACVLSFLRPPAMGERRARIVFSAASALMGIAVAGGLASGIANTPFEEALDYPYDRWTPITTYQTLGLVPAFIEVAQDLPIPVPDGYSREGASDLMGDLAAQFDAGMGITPGRQAAEAQFEELKPTVIAVMNESFADLSIYDELRAAGYSGPQSYNSLTGVLQRGPLAVSVLGGGTANSEFEFLTGNSSAFIGVGKYPYQLYDLSDCDSLVKQFESLGYTSTAIHPQDPKNWKRSTVYDQLGFDGFISIEELQDAPIYHSGATDASTYEKIFELLERDAAPQFIFDVTMQNHGGYGVGTVPEEDMVNLDVPGVGDHETLSELGVYLACVNRSDADFAYLIERLRSVGRPVVLVFFGDHQPSVSSALGDALCMGAETFDREWKKHESTYVVWANYEVAGAVPDSIRTTSASQLAAQVLYAIGAPLTERQKADLILSETAPAVSLIGWEAADGRRYSSDVEYVDESVIDQLQQIQYLGFGDKIR